MMLPDAAAAIAAGVTPVQRKRKSPHKLVNERRRSPSTNKITDDELILKFDDWCYDISKLRCCSKNCLRCLDNHAVRKPMATHLLHHAKKASQSRKQTFVHSIVNAKRHHKSNNAGYEFILPFDAMDCTVDETQALHKHPFICKQMVMKIYNVGEKYWKDALNIATMSTRVKDHGLKGKVGVKSNKGKV